MSAALPFEASCVRIYRVVALTCDDPSAGGLTEQGRDVVTRLQVVDERGGLPRSLVDLTDELIALYPSVEAYIGVRSIGGAGGGSGRLAVPVNLDALAFVNGRYWVGAQAPDEHDGVRECRTPSRVVTPDGLMALKRCEDVRRCGPCREAAEAKACTYGGCAADPDNWRPGFKRTVLELEASTRRVLGFGELQRRRPAGYPGYGPDPRVTDALHWLASCQTALADEHADWLDVVVEELVRILARANGMVLGGRRPDTVETRPCGSCGHPSSIVMDPDRAVCINPECRTDDGERRCWEWDEEAGGWAPVEMPALKPARARYVDEQATRWAAGAG